MPKNRVKGEWNNTLMEVKMRARTFIESFKFAIEGIAYALKTQRNIKIHLMAGLVVLLVGLKLKLTNMEWCIIIITVNMVIFAEMVNTAIEKTIDLYTEKIHPLAKTAKDVAAGAVLVSALSAILIGIIIFGKHFI